MEYTRQSMLATGFVPSWRDLDVLRHIDASSDALKCNRTYRIAILVPTSNHFVQEIYKGFVDTLRQQSPLSFEFVVFDANRDLARMRELVEEILQSEFDVLFSIGLNCTIMAKKVTFHMRKALPIVFCAVPDPVGYKIVDSVLGSGSHLTGVNAGGDVHTQQMRLLSLLRPDMKRVVLIYNPIEHSGAIETSRISIAQELERQQIDLKIVHVFRSENVIAKLEPELAAADCCVILRDYTVLDKLQEVVDACNASSTTLMTTDWGSVERGAVAGFCTLERPAGEGAAYKARLILEGDYHPRDIPITEPAFKYGLKINGSALDAQSVKLDEKVLSVLQSVDLI